MNRVARASTVICIAVLSVTVLITIIRGATGLPAPYLHNYGENALLVNAWGLATGHGLYRLSELNSVPVFMAPYPPVFYLIAAGAIKLWGISYVPGRLVSFIAMLGCAVMSACIARRRGCDTSSAVIAALAFLGAWPVYRWCRFMRVDSLAVFFELAAVFILLGRSAPKRRAAVFVAMAVLAGYTKQNAFGLAGGALLGMILAGDSLQKKRAYLIGSAYALTAVLVFLVIEAATGGSFHQFALGSFHKQMTAEVFAERVLVFLQDPISTALLAFAVIAAIVGKRDKWLMAFLAVPTVMALATVGKEGSGPNYFIETLAACAVGAAVLLHSVRSRRSAGRDMGIALICGILALCVASSFYIRKVPYKALTKSIKSLNSSPGPSIVFIKSNLSPGSLVLAQYSDMPLFANCVPAISDPYTLTRMARAGKWDPSPLVEALNNRRVDLVIMSEKVTSAGPMRFLPEAVAEAIERNYVLMAPQIPMYDLYAPLRVSLVQTPAPAQVPFSPQHDK